MMNISYVMGFIGVAVGILLGIIIYTSIENSVDCPDININPDGNAGCQKAKSLSWAVIAILPIAMFFGLFALFGGLRGY